MDRPLLDLQAWVADGRLRLALSGALVDGTTAALRTWMERHVPSTAGALVLDLSGLVEVDAVGLGALLAAHRRLAPGAAVVLEGATDGVALALRRSGLLALPPRQVPAKHAAAVDPRPAQQVPAGPASAQQVPAQQVSRTAPTMADVTTSTSDGLLTNGGIA